MKNKLFKKFYLSTVASVVISLSLIMILLDFSVSSYLSKEKKQLLTENCKTVSSIVTNSIGQSNFNILITNVVTVMARAIDAEIFMTDTQGKVFICSCNEWKTDHECVHSKTLIPEGILNSSMNGEYFELGNLGGRYNDKYYTVGVPLYDGNNNVIGTVFASSPASLLQDLLGDLVKMFIICALVPVVLLFIMVYAISYRLTKPLRLMSEASRSMSKGDFSKRIPVNGDDEINELAVAFNQMTNSLVQLEGMRRSFIANVSHELKTPMTTIEGFVEGIIDGTIEPEKQNHYLTIVSEETKRLSRLVQSMLSLAKLESGEMKIKLEPADFADIIYTTVIAQEQRIEKKILKIEGLDKIEETIVNIDSDLFHQVIYNLVDNAVKFTDENGYIRFSLEKVDNNNISFKIRNSGEGIMSKDLPFVFDRFYKADKARSAVKDSTGLGLYIVKTIVNIHNGKITARSLYGEYTEFEIVLPIGNSNDIATSI